MNEPIAQKPSEIETAHDEENLQMVSKAFGFEDEPEYSDCEHDDSESDSDDCFDLLLCNF